MSKSKVQFILADIPEDVEDDINQWIAENYNVLIGKGKIDVSAISLQYDNVWEYTFNNVPECLLFSFKWSKYIINGSAT